MPGKIKSVDQQTFKATHLYFTELLKGPLVSLNDLYRSEMCFGYTNIKSSDVICEIGCGAGATSFFLSQVCNKVVAFDISEPLIEYLSHKPHPANIEYVLADATKKPKDCYYGMFDKVISIDMMEYVEDPLAVFNFISYILKVGGSGVVTFPINFQYPGKYNYNEKNIKKIIKKSDLEMDYRLIDTDRFGLYLINFFHRMQNLLARPFVDKDKFHEGLCFQMIKQPKRVHNLYKFVICMLFEMHRNTYHECTSANRILIMFKKPG